MQIKEFDWKYTGFEANGRLYQFYLISFGVTNGVAVFQCEMDKFVEDESLKDTFPYLGNIIVAGRDQKEHDANVRKFSEVVDRRKLTLNESKSIKSKEQKNMLGYCVGNGVISPDEEQLKPLKDFQLPRNIQALRRVISMFAYHAKWIPNFSDKILLLSQSTTFPLDQTAQSAFVALKKELEGATLQSIDESLPFVVECDVSEVCYYSHTQPGWKTGSIHVKVSSFK